TDDHGCTDSADATITEPTELVLDVQATSNSCEGAGMGTAAAMATGGVAPYTITWATNPPQTGNSAQGMNPGSYPVTVTDANGCSANSTVTIDGFPSPVV